MSENKKSNLNTANDDIDISRLLGVLINHRWLIISITLLFSVISVTYVTFATPIYQSDALVQVEGTSGSSILNNISQIIPNSNSDSFSSTEIELIKSRMIIGKTVDDLNLDTVVNEKFFPIFGRGWNRLNNNPEQNISVTRLSVRPYHIGAVFNVKVVDKDSYVVTLDGNEVLSGKVGQYAQSDDISLLINEINAKPGTVFTVIKEDRLKIIGDISDELSVADKGKNTGILNLSLVGPNRVLVKSVLQSISNNYLLQNVERKSEEAAKSLTFLEQQLPEVRDSLNSAENKLNLYRQQNDSVDLSLEAKSVLDTIVSTESQLNELTFKEAEISKLYTKEHPAYKALLEKRETLLQERDKLNKRVSGMPKTQQEIIRLTRDVDSGKEIYMQLLNKQQELSITKASTVGNVRIIDPSVTEMYPVQPRKGFIVVLATVFGLLFSVTLIILKSMLHKGIESPEQLEEEGINVYASIPFSEWQQKKDKEVDLLISKKKTPTTIQLLAHDNPADLSIEAIRSLRTSLYFAMMEAKNNVLMVSGSSPNIGKTFVSINLAAVIAQSGKKVLIIDADMRKGYSHLLLGADGKVGLSSILSGKVSLNDAIFKTSVPGMDFISRGEIPPNPAELLMHHRLGEMFAQANEIYDFILVDTPPVLAVTDAAIIGQHAGTSLLVARFAINTVREVEVSIKRFEQNGVNIKGVILNAVEKNANNYYDYYEYDYRSKS